MSDAIEMSGVCFSYDEQPALHDINLSIEKRDLVGIIGPNGGGKTTLFRIILGLLKPAKGVVKVFGKSPKEARDKVGYVPQVATFNRDFPITVLEVTLMGRLGKRGFGSWFTKEDREDAMDALDKVGMLPQSNRQISQLSGGQLQRVLVARALVKKPELLLLDEPLSSIDPEAQKNFYELLNKLKQDMAIVIITHDITAASFYIEKIACLNVKLYYHGKTKEGVKFIEKTYQCPIELIAHGMPHRVLGRHD
ncbi:MAG: ABC transporter ATP-binding protein [Candidatus Micrarchaeota archaeon]